jgi:hypothetical protein
MLRRDHCIIFDDSCQHASHGLMSPSLRHKSGVTASAQMLSHRINKTPIYRDSYKYLTEGTRANTLSFSTPIPNITNSITTRFHDTKPAHQTDGYRVIDE